MELAVLADIHSNYIAMEQCVSYALERGIHRFVFLGDYIGELAYPERTMELLWQYRRKYDCVFVKGNKEDYWLNYRRDGAQGWTEYHSTTGALYYAYHHLKEEDLDFFENLPVVQEISVGGFPVLTVCHGSPTDVREALRWEDGSAARLLEQSGRDYILCGHTHVRGKVCRRGRTILNPGSVGMALGAGGMAQFAILRGRDGRWEEEFVSLEFNRRRVVRELYESGLMERAPYWCMITERLLLGEAEEERGHAEVLRWVMELCRQDRGFCNWPDIPEEYWEQAAKEFRLKIKE